MSEFLYRVGKTSYRKAWPFLVAWIVILGALGFGAAAYAKDPSPTFSMPDMDSTVTQEEMNDRFGSDTDAMSVPSGSVVIQAPEGKKLTDPAVMAVLLSSSNPTTPAGGWIWMSHPRISSMAWPLR